MAKTWPSGAPPASDINFRTKFSRLPSLGHFWPLHGSRWYRLSFKHPFYIGNQYCFTKICPKIDIWGWRLSRRPILGHFCPFPAISGPVHGPRWSRLCFNRPFLVGINVALTISALKSISEAGVDPDGQFWAISGHFWPRTCSEMVQDELQSSILYWKSILLYKNLS